MPALPLCGQCQAFPAEIDCAQCQEQFCGDCSAVMHRAGRMRGHNLFPVGSLAKQDQPPVTDATRPQSGPAHVSKFDTSFTRVCQTHPEEPLQFFCLDCETEPVCAECVVHHGSAHHGHRVLKIKEAFMRLSNEELPRLEQMARDRAEARAQAAQRAEALRRDLSLTISQGRQRIQEAFVRLRVGLSQKEAQLLAGVEDCVRAADAVLQVRGAQVEERAGQVWDSHSMLSKFETRGDEVKALNTYAAARVAVARFLEPMEGVDGGGVVRLLDMLKSQVREALKEQVAAVATLSTRVPEIRHSGGSGNDQCRPGAAAGSAAPPPMPVVAPHPVLQP